MNVRTVWRRSGIAIAFIVALSVVTAVFAQRPFRVYQSMEGYDDIPLPPDYQDRAEFVFAPLDVPQHPRRASGAGEAAPGLREGGTSWTQDYPRADRHFRHGLAAGSRG